LFNYFIDYESILTFLIVSPTAEMTRPPKENRQFSTRGRPRNSSAGRTRERILDSAEELFARRGFQKVSLRAITAGAGVNVALVNYYFGDKISLLNAVLERRAAPIIDHRNRLLDACAERAEKTGRLDAGEIIEAYIAPVLLSKVEDSNNESMQRMIGVAFSDSSLEMGRAIHRIFRGVAGRFIAMLREACPELSAEEFHWRLVCILGGMTYLLAEPGRVRRLVGPEFDALDKNVAMACAMPFLEAGMSAPPARPVSAGAAGLGAGAGAGDRDAFQTHTSTPAARTSSAA